MRHPPLEQRPVASCQFVLAGSHVSSLNKGGAAAGGGGFDVWANSAAAAQRVALARTFRWMGCL